MNWFTSLVGDRTPEPARRRWLLAAAACCAPGLWPINPARAQSTDVKRHLDAAIAAAGDDLKSYLRVADPLMPRPSREPFDLAAAINRRPAPPPAQAFDNLYFLGSHWVSAWALRTSDGFVLIDALNNDEEGERLIVGGMKQLGLDPAQIRTLVVTHGHGDHYGAANMLRSRYGTRVALSEADWSMMETKLEFDTPLWGRPPSRDIALKDGDTLRLGDAVLDILVTPGHTLGAVSPIFSVRHGAQTHRALLWGGIGFNFGKKPERMKLFVDATDRARRIVRERNVDVLISNHAGYDMALEKLPGVAPGKPNPFVMGTENVQRALTVLHECGLATLASWA